MVFYRILKYISKNISFIMKQGRGIALENILSLRKKTNYVSII